MRTVLAMAVLAVGLAGCQACGRPEAPPRLVSVPDHVSPLGQLYGPAEAQVWGPASSPPAAVTNLRRHTFQGVGADQDVAVDGSGRWMVFASTAHAERPDLFLKSIDGRSLTQLTSDPAADIQPDLSPDGKLVAFASNRGGTWDIYVMSVGGRTLRQITRGGGQNLHPSFSPDGRLLVYCCLNARSGQWELWLAEVSAPENRQFLGYGLFPAWSPVGDVIAFQRPRGTGDQRYGLWTIRLHAGEPSLPTLVAAAADAAYVTPAFSPDGRRLAFTAIRHEQGVERADIWCVDLDGQNLRRLTTGQGRKYGPAWAGERVFFSCNRDGSENIWSVPADDPPAAAPDGAAPLAD